MASFRKNIGHSILKKHKTSAKEERLLRLESAQNIGVVYDVLNTDHNQLNRVIHFFEAIGKQVSTLGFVDKKELEGVQISSEKEFYYSQKDLRFWKIPKTNAVSSFIKSNFDYLINLDTSGQLEIQAISVYSNAKVRIGKYFEAFPYSQDLMVKCHASNSEELFKEIKKFIEK